jgi:hypothetical protein
MNFNLNKVRRYVLISKINNFTINAILYSLLIFIFSNICISLLVSYGNSNKFIKKISITTLAKLFSNVSSDLLSKMASMVIENNTGGIVSIRSDSIITFEKKSILKDNNIELKIKDYKKYIGYTSSITNKTDNEFDVIVDYDLHLEDSKNKNNYFNGKNIFINTKNKIIHSDYKFYLKQDSCVISGNKFNFSEGGNLIDGNVDINFKDCGSVINGFLIAMNSDKKLVDESSYNKSLKIVGEKLEFNLIDSTFKLIGNSNVNYDSSINILSDSIYGELLSDGERFYLKKERMDLQNRNGFVKKFDQDFFFKKVNFDGNVVINLNNIYNIKSDYAVYDNQKRFIEFIDNVKISSSSANSESNYIVYDIANDKIIFIDKESIKSDKFKSLREYLDTSGDDEFHSKNTKTKMVEFIIEGK